MGSGNTMFNSTGLSLNPVCPKCQRLASLRLRASLPETDGFPKWSALNAGIAVRSSSSSADWAKEARRSEILPFASLRSARGPQRSVKSPDQRNYTIRANGGLSRGRRSMDFDRFFKEENLALYRLLASSTDVDERRAILRLLADETAKLKSELRQTRCEGNSKVGETRH